MQIGKDYFLVEIDKTAQNKKRSQIGSIYIPENFQDMAHNLQYGTVVAIGTKAAVQFPEVEEGDILIFHHHVEYKPRTDGDKTYNDPHLIETLENKNELRTVDISHEVFGVMKLQTNEIIPYKNTVFCHEEFVPASFQQTSGGIFIPDAWQVSMDAMNEKLDELKAQSDSLKGTSQYKADRRTNYKEVEQIDLAIRTIDKEREEISRKMNKERYMELTLLYINAETDKEWGGFGLKAGDKVFANSFALYPLDIDGVHFTLVNRDYIALIKTTDMKDFKPLHDRVIVIPEKKEQKSAGGIIIPDTVKEKPNKGVVKFVGPGKKDEPTTLKAKDKVMFGKNAGFEIEIDGEDYLMMRESDIYGSYK